MVRFARVLLLGAVAVGIVLALTSAPSSGAFGAQDVPSGYGDDVVQECEPGQTSTADDPCLEEEVVEGETASGETGDGDDGGVNPVVVAVVVVAAAAGAAITYGQIKRS
jgi:hypothetical protein